MCPEQHMKEARTNGWRDVASSDETLLLQADYSVSSLKSVCVVVVLGTCSFLRRSASRRHPNTNNRTIQAEFTMIKGTVKTRKQGQKQSDFHIKLIKVDDLGLM